MKIPLSRPDITELEKRAVLETLSTPYLSLGPKLREFETKFAAYLGVKHAVAVNSGTSALHLCVKALGIQDGDLVATTPFSFVASANCLLFERARPVFVDIDPVTLNIDVNKLEGKVRELRKKAARKGGARTSGGKGSGELKALLPVHVFGRPCDMAAIMDIAKRYEVRVIEDTCEALGAALKISGEGRGGRETTGIAKESKHRGQRTKSGNKEPNSKRPGNADRAGSWRKAGTFGDCAAFGFYPNKQMTTGEGGIVATNDDAIAAASRSMRNQGRGETAAWLQHERLGYNYRLSDINCALGIAQLSRLEEMLAKRERVAKMYIERLSGLGDLTLPIAGEGERISWFVFVVRLSDRYSREDRDALLARLRDKGIACSNYFSPIHLQPFYRKMFGFKEGDFPVTEAVAARTVALPFYNTLGDAQITYVCENLRYALGRLVR